MEEEFIEVTCSLDHPIIQAGVTIDEGCSISIFRPLLNSHCLSLREEMAETIEEQKRFEDTLNAQIIHPESHPLIKQIDEWEKESIDKIQKRANELRQHLLQLITIHTDELSERFEPLSQKIFAAKRAETFSEADIHRWKKILNDLKANLTSPPTIAINQDMNIPLLQNIEVISVATNDLFLQAFDDKVQIEEDGQLAIHNDDVSIDTTEIRGRNVYTTGCHQIRLHIEQSANKWTFLGINSKLTPLQSQSYSCVSSYGWSTNNYSWSNGQEEPTPPNQCVEMKTGDILSLIIDCDKFLIMMINERSQVKHELSVNIDNCPLPWQLHVVLHEPLSRIRILRKFYNKFLQVRLRSFSFSAIHVTKRICAADNGCNQRAITWCEGCSQRFCPVHFAEHRNRLHDEMNGFIQEHDDIKTSLEEQRKNGDAYQLIKRIYEREKESIAKIKKRAKELRLQLAQFAQTHNEDFKQKFQSLSEQINEYRAYGDFIETDLYRWKQTIDDLKLNFISPITVSIEQHDGYILVENITINVVKKATYELFEQIFDDKARIEQNG